jgi:glycosyltransferase involved in cell wall biosynthesis
VTRVAFITQHVDPGHPALAATVPKLRALAALVDEVVVLADSAVDDVLPPNCRVRTFRAARKAGRGARFEVALARELPGLRSGAVVAHMCPIYAVLAAPLARPLRVPLLLWFTHWKASRLLRAAERVSTAVVSVDRRSFPLPSGKVRAIGHGIDLEEFSCTPPREGDGELRLLALGRYSRAKGLDVVLRAVAAVGEGVRLEVRGPVLSADEHAHRLELEQLAARLPVDRRVVLGDPVVRANVPQILASHDVLVNNMRAGAPDKVVYEAAASCLPVIASNPVFDTLLDPAQLFRREDAGELAERIRALAALDPTERAAIGRRLRERVEKSHSVESWARGVLAAAGIER